MDESLIQQEINKYKKFRKVDGATYRKVNYFLRKRTYITAREWALARLCTDFRTAGGAEMTFIGKHLPELVPFMEEPYSPQAVNQARHSFKKKVRKASATFFYGAMCGFFTTDELDDLLFEASEVSRFLLEVEGTTLDIDEEIDIEDRITNVMRSVGEAAKTILKTRSTDEPDATEDITPTVQPVPEPFRHGRKRRSKSSVPQNDVPLNSGGESVNTSSTENTILPEERPINESGSKREEPLSDYVTERTPSTHSSDTIDPHDTASVPDMRGEKQEPINSTHNAPLQSDNEDAHP